MADGGPVQSVHSLPSKNLNIPPPIEYAKPPIKETSIKEANSAKGGCSVCGVAHSLSLCLIASLINSLSL